MNKKQYQEYLQSDHWKNLRARKHKKVRKSKNRKLRCSICASVESVHTHHLKYKNVYDVETCDLRMLCELCHRTAHELIAEGVLSLSNVASHHSLFAKMKSAVKKRLGYGNRNMFKEKSEGST